MTRLYRSEAVKFDKFEYVYTETRPWVTLAIKQDGGLAAEYEPSACENAMLDYIVTSRLTRWKPPRSITSATVFSSTSWT